MLIPDQVPDAVRRDIEEGLGPFFEPYSDDQGDGFYLVRDLAQEGPITNGSITAVAWEYRCSHVGWFQYAPPSGTVLTIRGATVVDHRNDEPIFHRNVDWLQVMYDLGYDLFSRKLVPSADRDAINYGPPKADE